MSFRPDLLMPKEKVNGSSSGWIPATPYKPIPVRPYPVAVDRPIDRHGNLLQMSNCQSAGLPGGYVEGMPNFQSAAHNLNLDGRFYGYSEDLAQRNSMINQIAGSYSQASSSSNNNNALADFLAMRDASFIDIKDRNQNRSVYTGERFLFSQLDSNWESNLAAPSFAMENQESFSRLLSDGDSQLQVHPSYMGYLNNNQPRSINIAHSNRIPKFNIQNETNRGMLSSDIQVPQNKDYCSSSNQMNNVSSMAQRQQGISTDGLFMHHQLMHHQPTYILHPPRIESDAASHLQFTPLHCLSVKPNLPTDGSTSQKQEKCKDIEAPIGDKTVKYDCHELLKNVVNSSSVALPIAIKENENHDKGSNKGVDLNKTPAEKPPKRRKIRPKVVRESKPKRTVNITTSKNTSSEGNPSGKRKYVRKNAQKEQLATNQQAETPTDPNAQISIKVCRRALNFDLQNTIDEIQSTTVDQEEKDQINLNCSSEVAESCSGTDSFLRTESAEKVGQSNVIEVENQQPETGYIFTPLMNQRPTVAFPASKENFEAENSHIIATKANGRCPYPCETSSHNEYTPAQRHLHALGSGQNTFQYRSSLKPLEKSRQPLIADNRNTVSRILPNSNDPRGSKRDCHTMGQICTRIINPATSSLLCQGVSLGTTHHHKKMRIDDGVYADRYSNHCIEAVDLAKRTYIAKLVEDVGANTFTAEMNHQESESSSGEIHRPEKPSNKINNFTSDWHFHNLTALIPLLCVHG